MVKQFLFSLLIVCGNDLYGQTIKGNLYEDLGRGKSKEASDVIVYLLPVTSTNQTLIRTASSYEVDCREDELKKAAGYRVTVTDREGNFYFNNIAKGKYLLKICRYYGGYYVINIKAVFNGTITLPRFEVDPPIH